jgi:general secretion pathway protein I
MAVANNVERLSVRLSGQNALGKLTNAGGSPKHNKGFSLLEILVAFTLLAVAMGVLMQIFSSGVNGATLADRYAKATMYAESKLATVGIEETLKEGSAAGKFDDDFSWSVVVRPYQDPFPRETSVIDYEKLMPSQLFEIALKVTFTPDDHRERVVNLSTLRIGPKT